VACEALTNAAKHARASTVDVEVAAGEGVLHVRVRDGGWRWPSGAICYSRDPEGP
jgi:signal transduction histidine kinase